MVSYKPGMIPRSALVEVEKGSYLLKPQARAYRRVKAAFQKAGKRFKIVDNTSAYRSAAVQNAMRHAGSSKGTAAERRKYNLNPQSTVSIAAHPYGTHEDGKAIDVLINGSSNPSASDIARMKKYGWIRTFGSRDPNHFHHDNKHALTPVTRAWCIANHLFVH